jgi:hypothetical protein
MPIKWEVSQHDLARIITVIDDVIYRVTTCRDRANRRPANVGHSSIHLLVAGLPISDELSVRWCTSLNHSPLIPFDEEEYDGIEGSMKTVLNFECRMLGGQEDNDLRVVSSQVQFQLVFNLQAPQPEADAVTGSFDITSCGCRLQPQAFSFENHSMTWAISWWRGDWHSAAMQGQIAVACPIERARSRDEPNRRRARGPHLFITESPRLAVRIKKYTRRGHQLCPEVMTRERDPDGELVVRFTRL